MACSDGARDTGPGVGESAPCRTTSRGTSDNGPILRRQIAELPTHHDEGIRRAQRPPSRGPLRLAVAASILVGAVAIGVPVLRAGILTGGDSAASGGGVTSGGAGAASGGEGAAFAVTGALKPFPSCDTVLQYFRDQAPEDLIARVGGGMAATTAGMPALSRLKSITRYACLCPPPMNREVTRPVLLRPPERFLDSTSDFSGVCLVISSRETEVVKRRVGVVGL